MSPVVPLLGLFAVLAIGAALRKPDTKVSAARSRSDDDIRYPGESSRVLRHTIAVNLSILLPELDELEQVASHASPSADVVRAKDLLRQAREVTQSIDSNLRMAISAKDLGDILSGVFAAMSNSSDARRLLGACHPLN